MNYAMYLRKSRADEDAERHGEGETLARHKAALLELAKKQKLSIYKKDIYEEVVSADTIEARPKVQELLTKVEEGYYTGVLVMEVERLARGETLDQGIVAQAFKYGNAKIITPIKTYDPNNEYDEEYFEFGLFMSRREYKTINRRIQRGRIASVNEGKYIAGSAPIGYERVKIENNKGYTLKIVPEQAEIVKMIYEWYTRGELQVDGTYKQLGMYLIAKKLDSMHIKPVKAKQWSRSSIKDILTNPTYIGKIRWQWRKVIKTVKNGNKIERRPKDDNCMIVDGIHEAIIDEAVFNKAQEIISGKKIYPIVSNKNLKNPLTKLVKCGKCGSTMTRVYSNTKDGYYSLKCSNERCDNISSPIYLIEKKILESLKSWVTEYRLIWEEKEVDISQFEFKKNAVSSLENELTILKKQYDNTYDLLEQGIYTTEKFFERNNTLNDKINELTTAINDLQKSYDEDIARERAKTEFIPKVENLLNVYNNLETAADKNNMLREILEEVQYTKTEKVTKGKRDHAVFKIRLFPRLPRD